MALCDTVDNSLIVEDLAGRNGRFAAVLNGFDERADFFIENVVAVMCFDDRDLGLDLFAGNRMINGHRAADRAVPAVGRRNAKTCFGTENDGVAGGVDVHGPSNTEVENDVAFETNEMSYLHQHMFWRVSMREGVALPEVGEKLWVRIPPDKVYLVSR